MYDWKKFNATSLPKKEDFCTNLSMEDITAADYMHAKRVHKDFEKTPRCRSSYSKMFFKIGVLKNFTNFTGKLCWR